MFVSFFPRPRYFLLSALVFAVIAFVGSFIGVTYYLTLFFRLFATEALADDSPPSG